VIHGVVLKEEDILEADLYRTLTRFLLRVGEIPTVHLSLPDGLYKELKSRAEELGIQVTDLIKIYITVGLQKELATTQLRPEDRGSELTSRIFYIEGKLAQLTKLIESIISKISELEERVEELESPDVIPEVLTSRRKG